MALSTAKLAMINTAATSSSRSAVLDIFLNTISSNLNSGYWLNPGNRYIKDTTFRLENDISSSRTRDEQVKEYIAVSSILHCSDGWNFLSSAIDCLLSGKFSHAIHLAYYAELRAAMSFLASFGIGVFNYRHAHIDLHGNVVYTHSNISTHVFTWKVLEDWAQDLSKGAEICNIIKISGKTLSDWINADNTFLSGATTGYIGKRWLEIWSLDLQTLANDQHTRNEASYRPRDISSSIEYDYDFQKELDFVVEKWRLCEPKASSKFSLLDNHLLRDIMISTFKAHYSKEPNIGELDNIYSRMRSNLGLPDNIFLRNFLTRRIQKNRSQIIKWAKLQQKDTDNRFRPVALLSRAFLLLRIATGAVNNSLDYSSISQSDYDFWSDNVGTNNAIWAIGSLPTAMDDLWIDIEDCLGEIEGWLNENPNCDRLKLHSDLPSQRILLPQSKRILLWGMNG